MATSPCPTHTTIVLPESSADIAAYLSLATNKPLKDQPTVQQLDRLATMCRHLGSDLISARIQVLLYAKARAVPWKVFVVASKLGDMELGKMALAHLGNDKNKAQLNPALVYRKGMEGLDPDWQFALVRAMAKHPGFVEDKAGRMISKWALISEDFEL